MSCDHIQAYCEAYFDGELTEIQQLDIDNHLSSCDVCRNVYAAENKLHETLRALPVPPASPGFTQRALQQARSRHTRPRLRWYAYGFGSAVTAALVVVFLATAHFSPVSHQDRQEIVVDLNRPHTVSLVFNAPDDIDDVTLSMQLPVNFELANYPGQRVFEWQTRLKKGRNVLTIPVVALRDAKGELVAGLTHGDKVKTFRILLSTQKPDMSKLKTVHRNIG